MWDRRSLFVVKQPALDYRPPRVELSDRRSRLPQVTADSEHRRRRVAASAGYWVCDIKVDGIAISQTILSVPTAQHRTASVSERPAPRSGAAPPQGRPFRGRGARHS